MALVNKVLANNLSSIPEPMYRWKERVDSTKLFSAMEYRKTGARTLLGEQRGRKWISSSMWLSMTLTLKNSASGAGDITSVVRAHCSYRLEFSSQHPNRLLSTTCNSSAWDLTLSSLYRHLHTVHRVAPTHYSVKELVRNPQHPSMFIIYPKPTNTCTSHII